MRRLLFIVLMLFAIPAYADPYHQDGRGGGSGTVSHDQSSQIDWKFGAITIGTTGQFRVSGGFLQYSNDSGSTWANIGSGGLDITGLTEDTAPTGSYFVPVYSGSANKKVSLTNLLGTSGISDAVPFFNSSATTKKFHFVASAITAGQNRAITLPDGDVTVPAGTLLASGGPSPSRDPVVGDPDSWTIAASDWYGGTLIANAAGEFSITPAVTGVNFVLKVEGAHVVIANPDATGTADTITLNGTALTQGQAIKSDGTAGALVVCQYRSPNALSCDSDSHWAGE